MTKVKNLFGEWIDIEGSPLFDMARDSEGACLTNPMVEHFEEFGNGVKCRGCVSLLKCGRKGRYWFKCKKRNNGNGGKMYKHNPGWLACKFFELPKD